MTKKIIRIFSVIILLLSLWFAYLGYEIVSFASIHYEKQASVAIVLGAAAWKSEPSPVFKERIDHAIGLYQKKRVKKIIFTGGKGERNAYAESEVAKAYAIKKGVSAADILTETVSKTTIQNIRESKVLIKAHSFRSIVIVSDPLHMKRAIRIARDMGINAFSSPTKTSRYRKFYNKTKFLFREIYFYQRYLLLGK